MKVVAILGGITLLILGAVFAVAILCGEFCPECLWFVRHRNGHERISPASSLKQLSSAEADFRANDRDRDKICQFWRTDVAGLYTLVPNGGEAIKLIDLSVAAADDRPVTDLSRHAVRAAKYGYWYRAIRHVDEDPKAPDPDRFAFCAFPDSSSSGKYLFIVDERNTIYRAEAKGNRGIEVFPTPEELKQWTKVE